MPRCSFLVTGIDALRRLLILELLISFKRGNTGKFEVGPGGGGIGGLGGMGGSGGG